MSITKYKIKLLTTQLLEDRLPYLIPGCQIGLCLFDLGFVPETRQKEFQR